MESSTDILNDALFAVPVAGFLALAVRYVAELIGSRRRESGRARTEERLLELGEDQAEAGARALELSEQLNFLRLSAEALTQQAENSSSDLESEYLEDRIAKLHARQRRVEAELTRTLDEVADLGDASTSEGQWAQLQAERAERRQLEAKLAEYERVVPFEVESRRAKWSSTVAFVSGVIVVLIIFGVAVRDWWEHDTSQALTTGTGIARLGAVLAAFYVAGQLFKRSTALQLRAQEFERAAIAMQVTPDLAEQIVDIGSRDQFVKQIYLSHLASPSPGRDGDVGGGEATGLDVAAVIDAYNKLRAGG